MKDNDKNRPISIVMTPTRNDAWVIRAFLECNGLWADYIIIADQMSTDGTREIANAYNHCHIDSGSHHNIVRQYYGCITSTYGETDSWRI